MASRFLAPAITFGRTPARMPIDPFRVLQGMDSLLSDVARVAGPLGTAGSDDALPSPRINVEDRENEIRVTAELPGIRESDVHITLNNDMLTIEGEKKREETVNEGDLRVVERAFGQFRRVLQLP
ncbi:MAG: Heat shock protein Hsp20, partial [Alphaproteobacteria bacterium]|nr:Heat shock protein Hsp20 [Alphaproteobacteria bacterium]